MSAFWNLWLEASLRLKNFDRLETGQLSEQNKPQHMQSLQKLQPKKHIWRPNWFEVTCVFGKMCWAKLPYEKLVIYLIYPQMVLTGSPSGKYPFDVEHSRRCCRITFAITGFVVASLVNFEPFFTLLSLLIIVTTPKGLWTEICKNEKKLS